MSVKQDLIVNIEVPCFFNMKGPSFVVHMFDYVPYMVVHGSHTINAFFCSGRGVLVVVKEVNPTGIEAVETSVRREFVGSGACGSAGTFRKR